MAKTTFPEEFIKFVNGAPSPFHAVAQASQHLDAAGFKRISESDPFPSQPGGLYYFTRNRSSIVSFAIGGKWKKGNGVHMIAAHTDSPNLQVKPISRVEKEGYLQVGVQTYGGGLWHTWFDRDLTLAGRVMVRDSAGGYKSCLVHIKKPILRIPTLAIHLDRNVTTDGFKYNVQQHLPPILATTIKTQLSQKGKAKEVSLGDAVSGESGPVPATEKHHPQLIELLATELGCAAGDIESFELSVCDCQPATIGGIEDEFIFSPRLDNLMMSFCGLQAFTHSLSSGLSEESNVRALILFDHEEVGSASAHGAGSPMVYELVKHLSGEETELAVRRSFLISADMAHAVHPNYSDKHEPKHKPELHKGLALKYSANQRYATTAVTALPLISLARKHKLPLQEFVVRTDLPGGSTIGPIISANTGIRTVDVGNPQLSMHSIRETCATTDVDTSIALLKAFYEEFSELDTLIKDD